MAITATITPATISLAGNPIGFLLNTDNLYSVAGDQERIGLQISAGGRPDELDTISIAWDGQTALVFTAKDSPNDLGYELPTDAGATLTDEEYADLLVVYFSQNYYLYKAFEIYKYEDVGSGEFGVVIKYRKPKLINSVVVNGLNNIASGITPGVDSVSNDMSMVVKLMMEKDDGLGDFEEIMEVEYKPDTDGNIEFDLSEAIRANLGFPLPGYGIIDPSASVNFGFCKQFYVKWVEKTGQTYLGLINSQTYRAIATGIEWDKFLYYDVDDVHKNGSASYKFATFQPRVKMIALDGKDFLYVFHYLAISFSPLNVTLKADITYADGTLLVAQDIQAPFVAAQYNLIVIPSGRGQITLPDPSPVTNPIYKYELYLWNIDTNLALTEKFTYIIDRRYYEYNRSFLFKNSVGVYEMVWCHGQEEISAEIGRMTAMQHVPFNYTATDAEDYQYGHTYRKTFKANTGTKKRAYIEYLLELLGSDEVYIKGPLVGDAGDWFPVKILTDKVKLREYAKINNSLEFEWQYRFTNINNDTL